MRFFDGIKREKKRVEKASDKRIFFLLFFFLGILFDGGCKNDRTFEKFWSNVTKKYFI